MDHAPEAELDPIADEIFDLMRRQPGDIFSVDDIAVQLSYSASEITPALSRLEQRGLAELVAGRDPAAYILSPSAPEL